MHLEFIKMDDSHLELFCQWLNLPHVAEVWDGAMSRDEVKRRYFSADEKPWFHPYIVTAEGDPCAFVQVYHDSGRSDGWWSNYDGDIWGVDLFIAKPLWQGYGLGPKILRKMVARLRQKHGKVRVFADPSPDNKRSLRAFEKAFFEKLTDVETPEGPAVLMEFRGPPSRDLMSLRELTPDNYSSVMGLVVAPDQRRFVATNAVSIAQASFDPRSVMRGIFAGETPVGFVLLRKDHEDFKGLPTKDQPEIWRFMIGEEYQGYGYGKRALDLICEELKGWPGATKVYLSYVEGEGSPVEFYLKCGFVETGVLAEWERIMVKELRSEC